jgi:transposase
VAGLAATRPRIVVGVDTHKYTHVAVALDQLGSLLGSTTITVNRAGYSGLRDCVGELAGDKDGVPVVFGIEGTGSHGAGLASFLRRAGDQVIEVNRVDRTVRHLRARTTPSTPRPLPAPSWRARPPPSRRPARAPPR